MVLYYYYFPLPPSPTGQTSLQQYYLRESFFLVRNRIPGRKLLLFPTQAKHGARPKLVVITRQDKNAIKGVGYSKRASCVGVFGGKGPSPPRRETRVPFFPSSFLLFIYHLSPLTCPYWRAGLGVEQTVSHNAPLWLSSCFLGSCVVCCSEGGCAPRTYLGKTGTRDYSIWIDGSQGLGRDR